MLGLLVQGPHREQWGLGGEVPYLTANFEGSRGGKRPLWKAILQDLVLCRFPTCLFKGLPVNRNTLECGERAEKERTNWWSSTRLTELMNLGFLWSWRKWCWTPALSSRLSSMTLSSYLCNKALLLVCNLLPSWWNLHYVLWYTVRGERRFEKVYRSLLPWGTCLPSPLPVWDRGERSITFQDTVHFLFSWKIYIYSAVWL